MSMVASTISALPAVRHYLTRLQRELAAKGGFVAEGRDLGTVVFPQAAYKFFLDAKAEKRCQRRVSQLQRNGVKVDSNKILQMIIERDRSDSERSLAPLKKAADALLIDTTNLDVEQVCGVILASIEKRPQ
jgi:cytidylate kinase